MFFFHRYYIIVLIVYFHFFPQNIFYNHFQIKGNLLFLFLDAFYLLWTFLTHKPTHSKQFGHTLQLSTASGFCLQLTPQEPDITHSSCLATLDRSLAITALILYFSGYKTELDIFWISINGDHLFTSRYLSVNPSVCSCLHQLFYPSIRMSNCLSTLLSV